MESFEKNVFINCPFDKNFEALLRPLLFSITYFDYYPRIASEESDGSVNRSSKLISLIRESKYSIHDLSLVKSTKKNQLARLNMPFELGIDFGSKQFSPGHSGKKFLILSSKEHDYKRAFSDFAGFDARVHKNDPVELVIIIRNWFYETIGETGIETGIQVWHQFQEFLLFLITKRYGEGYRGDKALQSIYPVKEYIQLVKEWKKEMNHSS